MKHMALILIAVLAALLAISCNPSIGNNGGHNQDNDNYNIDLDFNGDGKVDDSDLKAQCTLCFSDPEVTDSCGCASEIGCDEKDIRASSLEDFYSCETPIVLGEEIIGEEVFEVDSGFGEGAI